MSTMPLVKGTRDHYWTIVKRTIVNMKDLHEKCCLRQLCFYSRSVCALQALCVIELQCRYLFCELTSWQISPKLYILSVGFSPLIFGI